MYQIEREIKKCLLIYQIERDINHLTILISCNGKSQFSRPKIYSSEEVQGRPPRTMPPPQNLTKRSSKSSLDQDQEPT